MAFNTQIQSLTGTATDSEMDQWLTDGVKEIIHILPAELKAKCSTVSTLNNSATTLDVDSKGDILHVTRLSANSSGYQVACREIPAMYAGLAEDSSNLMFYATVTDPVYWVDSSSGVCTLKVKPTPEATQTSIVHHITYPTVDADSDSTIANFPDEAEYLVVLYAACKVLHNKMNEKSGNLPSDVSGPVLESISTSLPSSLTLPSIPVAPSMSEKSVTITGTAPTYTQVVLSLSDAPTVGTLSITAVTPVPPALDSTPVSTSGLTNPTYTAPVMNPPDWSDTNTWISTEEDSEMLNARVSEITAKVQEYQVRLGESKTQFDKETTILNKDLQVALKDAELGDRNKLTKYASQIQSYQAEIAKQVQEFQIDLNANIEVWSAKRQTELQKYTSDIQNNLNVFNEESAEYQEIQSYTAQIGKEVQNFSADLQKYASEIGKITESNQSKLAKYAQDIANYGAKIQKHSTDYQWLQGQYAQLKQDYSQGIQILIGGGNPPQQQEGGK